MPGDFGDFSVNIGLGINFLAFVPQFVTLRDTLTYVVTVSEWLCTSAAASVMTPGRKKNEESERENVAGAPPSQHFQ